MIHQNVQGLKHDDAPVLFKNGNSSGQAGHNSLLLPFTGNITQCVARCGNQGFDMQAVHSGNGFLDHFRKQHGVLRLEHDAALDGADGARVPAAYAAGRSRQAGFLHGLLKRRNILICPAPHLPGLEARGFRGLDAKSKGQILEHHFYAG